MTSLPSGLTEDQYRKAIIYAKLASKSYDADDWLVVRLGMRMFMGIDDIMKVNFETPGYRKVGSGGNKIDWWGGNDQGLDYTLFENKDAEELIIAFRGTEPLSFEDWLEDAEQVLGGSGSEQYSAAVKLAKDTAKKVKEHNKKNGTLVKLSFCGHSLGGGLATAAALATGLEAVAFDAAGISDSTIKNPELGLDVANAARVINFNVKGCFVSDWNGNMDETTLGTLGSYESKQYGKIYWLGDIVDRAVFLPARVLLFVGARLEATAETFLAHAWHVFTYQLVMRNFVVPETGGRRRRDIEEAMAGSVVEGGGGPSKAARRVSPTK